MGWWSAGILGGDSPLDAIYDYEDYTGVERGEMLPLRNLSNKVVKHIKELIEKDCMAWYDICKGDSYTYDSYISAQVGAVIALAVGAKLTDEYKRKVVSAILKDEWAKEDTERKANIDILVEKVKASDGTKRLVLDSVGLFRKMGGDSTRVEQYDEA